MRPFLSVHWLFHATRLHRLHTVLHGAWKCDAVLDEYRYFNFMSSIQNSMTSQMDGGGGVVTGQRPHIGNLFATLPVSHWSVPTTRYTATNVVFFSVSPWMEVYVCNPIIVAFTRQYEIPTSKRHTDKHQHSHRNHSKHWISYLGIAHSFHVASSLTVARTFLRGWKDTLQPIEHYNSRPNKKLNEFTQVIDINVLNFWLISKCWHELLVLYVTMIVSDMIAAIRE